MKDNLARLLLCLASLGLRKAELNAVLDDLHTVSRSDILDRVAALQSQAKTLPVDVQSLFPSEAITSRYDSIGRRVAQLLRIEARMGTAEAVGALSKSLIAFGVLRASEVPALSRKSLEDWVLRLASRVSEKEILRLATIIRNEKVHNPHRDWNLSGSNR